MPHVIVLNIETMSVKIFRRQFKRAEHNTLTF
jgi:hypothetical protein